MTIEHREAQETSGNSEYVALSLTRYVAEFAAMTQWRDIPDEVMHLGKKSILDVLGCALSGSISPTVALLRNYHGSLRAQAGGGSVIIGGEERMPARFAAVINGTAMHVDDFDDTQQAATGKFQGIHPSAPVLAALLAKGEEARGDGRDLLVAYHVGVEVACKLFDATAPQHILGGYHSTGTCGMLGAAAAVGRFTGCDADTMEIALGIAATQASGLSENFGTMSKPFHAGHSADCGIVSAELAALGFTASHGILEARRGFFSAQGGGYEAERIEARLGNPWAFADRGVWLKPWPTGSLSHPGMTLMLELIVDHGIEATGVEHIELTTSENIHRTLLHHRPKNELEAKFSLEFCLAGLLAERTLTLSCFTDDFVTRPDIQALIERVDYRTFSEAQAREEGYTIVTTFIDITMKDGRVFKGRRNFGKGSLADPMTDAEVEAKFRACAVFAGWPDVKSERVIDLAWNLENAGIEELARCLTSAA
jgi:2-methylcitrate dehydratase PrpD